MRLSLPLCVCCICCLNMDARALEVRCLCLGVSLSLAVLTLNVCVCLSVLLCVRPCMQNVVSFFSFSFDIHRARQIKLSSDIARLSLGTFCLFVVCLLVCCC